jgi:cysteine desulfurase
LTQRRIYLDNNATTRVDPAVLEAMLPYFCEKFGNAASRNHEYGWEAEEGVELGRQQVADVIGADIKEIIFTSGATESNNIAIKGAAAMYGEKGRHIITQPTEHKAVLDPCGYLQQRGFRVTMLGVDPQGMIDLDELRDAMTPDTILVSIMHGNNEIGTLQPIAEIGRMCKEREVLFHTDCCQTFGKVPIDVNTMGIDMLSVSGHKIHGPKGVGALYVRRKKPRVRLEAVLHGGGHERGMRSGTLNVPGIVGLGKAAEISRLTFDTHVPQLKALRDRMHKRINDALDEVHLNGHATLRTPNNLNLSFSYVEGESLMMGFNDVAVSSGSACTSASLEPSYVLKALGVGDELAHSSIRFSFSRFNTAEEVDYVSDKVIRAVRKLREMSPLYEMAKEGIDLKTVEWAHH